MQGVGQEGARGRGREGREGRERRTSSAVNAGSVGPSLRSGRQQRRAMHERLAPVRPRARQAPAAAACGWNSGAFSP
jgi:hypothetical protein